MITSQEHTGFIKVEEYSLDAWLTEVESVIKQGYTFDFSSNETFPQAFGSMYTVVMVPVVAKTEVLFGKKESTEATIDVAPSDTPDVTVDEVAPVQTKRKNAKN